MALAFVVVLALSIRDARVERERLVEGYKTFASAIRVSLTGSLEEKMDDITLLMSLAASGRVDWDELLQLGAGGWRNPDGEGQYRFVHAAVLYRGDDAPPEVFGETVAEEQIATLRGVCAAASASMGATAGAVTILAPLRLGDAGRWVIPVANHRQTGAGCAADIVLIYAGLLNALLAKLDVDFALLTSTDGTILARHPDADAQTGRSLGQSSVFAKAWADAPSGTLVSTSPVDGKVRINAYGQLAGLPVVVAVGFEEARVDAVIAKHHRSIAVVATTAGVLLFLIFLWTLGLAQERARREAEYSRQSAAFQRRLQIALEQVDRGVWEWEVSSGEIYLSDDWRRRFEVADVPGEARFRAWMARVHEQDRAGLLAALNQCVSGEVDSFEARYRMRAGPGDWRWLLCIGAVVERDDDSKAARILGTLTDVTEAEERNIELRLSSLVFDEAVEGIAITDAQNRFIRVNKAFCAITGYTEAEVLGQSPGMLSSGLQNPSFYTELWKSLQAKGMWRGEIWNRHKSGSFYAEWLSITVVRDDAGQVVRYVAIFSDITEEKQKDELIQRQALFDALTNLPNRRLFFDRLDQEIQISEREERPFTLLFVDLDHFKQVNDHHGHATGDRVLIEVAHRLTECCRASDTVARIGGDEFVILARSSDAAWAENLAAKVITALRVPVEVGGKEFLLSASVGVANFPSDGRDVHELMSSADTAMYAAKGDGRNTFQFFTREMQEATRQRIELTTALRQAARAGAFELYMQPIYSMETGRIVKAEALIRWRHNNRFVPPSQFIPLAEDSDLICDIGDWVFERTVHMFEEIAARGVLAPEFAVAINKSARHLETRDSSGPWLARLESAGVPTRRIVLEITERLLLRDREKSTEQIERFAAAGVAFAVDDFGTGYSALAYLKTLPINQLKIDRSFVIDMLENRDNLAIVEAIVAMAHKIGLTTIAEGIETQPQFDALREMGCDMAQGYLLARPMPIPEFMTLLERQGMISLPVDQV